MKFTLNIPASWNELPPNTLKKIAWYFYNDKTGKELDLLIYFALLNYKWWQFVKIFKAFRILHYSSLTELKKHYAYIYKESNRTTFIPTIKTKNNTLYAPGNRLHNIDAEEFAMCEDLFWGFAQTGKLGYIRNLVACLYREKVENKKVRFDKTEQDERVVSLAHIDDKTLLAIMLCYKGSSLEIQNNPEYKKIFRKAAPPKEGSKPTKPTAPGFGNIIQHMAGGKFGTLAQTKRTNVHEFLSEYAKLLEPKKIT